MQVEICQPVHSRGVRFRCCTHRDVSEHVGHVLNSSSLVTRQGNKLSIWAGCSGVSSKYKFAMTKTFFLSLWKQKKSIGIETYSPVGWISKVIIHWEERLRSCFIFDCTNITVSYAQAFVPVSSTEKVWDKEEFQRKVFYWSLSRLKTDFSFHLYF